jgi:acetylornithine deacetylase/succinyl-diaminopimelate desuccinylase-like protein
MIDWDAVEADAAKLLSRYIQFDTTNPPGQEAPAIEFLADELRQRGFEPNVLTAAPGRANLIVRWRSPGQVKAGPILLYAHADVVPASAGDWSVPPFAGRIKEGFVWGRGALDDKGLGIIFLQSLSLLKQQACPLQRDVILLIGADEEACGGSGVCWLLKHHPDLIKAEFVWDEGGMGLQASTLIRDSAQGTHPPLQYVYNIAIAEKTAMTVKLVASGTPGHASIPHSDSATDRLVRALTRIKSWERPMRLTEPVIQMLRRLASSQPFPYSFLFAQAGNPLTWPFLRLALQSNLLFAPLIRNTVNLTMLKSGQKSNVIPAQAEAKLDIRLLPGEEPEAILSELRSAMSDAKVEIMVEDLPALPPASKMDTAFYQALTETLSALAPPGLVTPYLSPGATDSRFFRQAAMQAYGFMPMLLNAQELSRIHGVDERVSLANLRWGIQVVFETLQKL